MFHPYRSLLLCIGLLALLLGGCGQKGPLFLPKQQNLAPIVTEEPAPTEVDNLNDETQKPEHINHINAD